MKTHIIELMAKKQVETGRIINASTIIEETGLARPTIASWIKGNVKRFDESIIVALCTYFDCDLCDLLSLEEVEDEVNGVAE